MGLTWLVNPLGNSAFPEVRDLNNLMLVIAGSKRLNYHEFLSDRENPPQPTTLFELCKIIKRKFR